MCQHNAPILGIDPGTRFTGYGIISLEHGAYHVHDYGCITPPPKALLSNRYLAIYQGVEELIIKYQPAAVSVETQFLHKNFQSALKLGMACAAVMIAAKQHNLPIFGYTPAEAKKTLGYGRLHKERVQMWIQQLLTLPGLPEPEDAADALLLALCHLHRASSPAMFSPQEI